MNQNIEYKPFKWAPLTLIIQFDFCPRCEYFHSCYELTELANRIDTKKPIIIRGSALYISEECLKNKNTYE